MAKKRTVSFIGDKYTGRNARLPRYDDAKSFESDREYKSSILTLPKFAKSRWNFEKPDILPCKTYKVDPVALAEGQIISLDQDKKPLALPLTPVVKIQAKKPKASKSILAPPRAVKTFAELKVSDELAIALNGAREAPNQAGRVDVLTKKYVIEIKMASDWKHGIGQVLVYSFYYPDKQPVLFLFGDDIENYRNLAKQHCKRLGVIYSEAFVELI